MWVLIPSGSWLGLSSTATNNLALFLLLSPPSSFTFLPYMTKERDLLVIASVIEKPRGPVGGCWGKWDGGSGGSRGLSGRLCLPRVCSSWDKGAGRTACAAELAGSEQRRATPRARLYSSSQTGTPEEPGSSAGGPLCSWECENSRFWRERERERGRETDRGPSSIDVITVISAVAKTFTLTSTSSWELLQI